MKKVLKLIVKINTNSVIVRCMKPIDYFYSLSQQERQLYARRAGCSFPHLKHNVFRKRGVLKTPRNDLLIRLVIASEGAFSIDDAVKYFFIDPLHQYMNEIGLNSLITKGGIPPTVTPIETANAQDKKSYPQPKPELPSFGAGRV